MNGQELKDKLVNLLLESVDINKLVAGVLDEVIDEALQKVVDDSANPFDNAAKAMLYPLLSSELKKLVESKVAEIKA
jgi:hypothetical protein